MTRKRKPDSQTIMAPEAAARGSAATDHVAPVTVAHAGAEIELQPGQSASFTMHQSQVDRANTLARAREEGEREGAIATFCECAAIAKGLSYSPSYSPYDVREDILAELRRRFQNDARVAHHMKIRGLA